MPENSARRAVGVTLSQIFRERNLQIKDVARSTSIHRNRISQLASGKVTPTLFELLIIAQALELSPVEFLKSILNQNR